MKNIILASLLMIGCTDGESLHRNITYFKDERTGLCFAEYGNVGSITTDAYTITCVPCDSLKNINLGR